MYLNFEIDGVKMAIESSKATKDSVPLVDILRIILSQDKLKEYARSKKETNVIRPI